MQPLTTWQTAPKDITLSSNDLHVWRIALHRERDVIARSRAMLNDEEKARADRLIVKEPRQNFTIARAALRSILSRYLNTPADKLEFIYGPQGKPVLATHELFFNLTHSRDIALLAITRHAEVGIDIEHMDPARATEDIAARFFSPAEQSAFAAYHGDERIRAFFRCWSRKEAVIKALGEGLLCPLNSFDVSLDEHDARLLAFRRHDIDASTWRIMSVFPHPAYMAAVATSQPVRQADGYLFNIDEIAPG